MELEKLEQFVNKVIKYKEKEYIVNKVKRITNRNMIFTDFGTLGLYDSEVADIIIVRTANKYDIRKANLKKDAVRTVAKQMPKAIVERSTKKEKKQKEKLKVLSEITEEDEKYIIENWHLIGSIGCKKELEISRNAILEVVEKHDLRLKRGIIKKTRKIIFSDENNKFIKDNWEAMKLEDISKKVGVSSITLSKHAKNVLNLPARSRFVEVKKFVANEEVTKNSDVQLFKKVEFKVSLKPTKKVDEDKFSQEEKDFILKHWDSWRFEKFLEHFKMDGKKFYSMASDMNLKRRRVVKPKNKDYSEDTKEEIRKLWLEGHSQTYIRLKLKIQQPEWKRQLNSLKLPVRVMLEKKTEVKKEKSVKVEKEKVVKEVKTEKPKEVKVKKELSESEIDFLRENWMHKSMEYITEKLGMDYLTLSRLMKPHRFPRKRRIKAEKKKEDVKLIVPSNKNLENLIENYKEAFEMLIKNQNSDNIFLFRKKSEDAYEITDDKNNVLWSSDKANKKFAQTFDFRTDAWTKDEESLIVKELMSYIRRRNMHIENNHVKMKALEVYPIDILEIKNIVGFLYFDEFLKDVSDKTNRKIHAIKTRYGKLNLLKFNEKMKPENITSKTGRNN